MEREEKRASIQEGEDDRALVVADGDLVLIRLGSSVGAFRVQRQSLESRQMDCEWWFREDGDGRVVANDPNVHHGFAAVDSELTFGPFLINWHPSSDKFGWISGPTGWEKIDPTSQVIPTKAPPLSNISCAITRLRTKRSLDLHSLNQKLFRPIPINWPKIHGFYMLPDTRAIEDQQKLRGQNAEAIEEK